MPLLDLFWTMLLLYLFFIWIWFLISLFSDIIRRDDVGGWAKAAWTIFLLLVPLLGALVYVISNGDGMAQRRASQMSAARAAQDDYIRSVAGGPPSTADELGKLSNLVGEGVITQAEFDAQKEKLLA